MSNWRVFSPESPVLIQGMTGKEGARMARWLIQSGVSIVAGVTPGKGGQIVEDRPIFNTVQDAIQAFPHIQCSSIVVPATRVRTAVEEAIDAGIRVLHILTESVPVQDVLAIRDHARLHQATVLGPSSIGYLQFPRFRLGYLGGENPFTQVSEGEIALVSTSGGMVNEIMMGLARLDMGVKVAFAVGGDRFPLFSLEDALAYSDQLEQVKQLVVFAEPGRPFLQRLLEGQLVYKHRLILFLAGDILDQLPRGKAYGHTGTLLQEEALSVTALRASLREQGIACVATMPELIQVIQSYV